MTERIRKTKEFLRAKLAESPYFLKFPAKGEYRLEHSFRVARIAGEIARAEQLDEESAVIAGLLHDVSYCREFEGHDDWMNHGRDAARIARPFLEELGLPQNSVEEIAYGIAIHVDGEADFEGTRTPIALTVMDADNIDRFDVYRIYEMMEHVGYSRLRSAEKRAYVHMVLCILERYEKMELATKAATELWRERISYYCVFYRKLLAQLDAGCGYIKTEPLTANPPEGLERLLQLSGHF